jgi:polyferredoxin
MRTARRLFQVLFLLFFFFLFFQARYPYETGLPSDLFLRASPLVAIATMISARAFIATMVIGLVVLLLTIPLGRVFCGWICPLGTTLDASDRFLIKARRQKPRQRDTLRFRSYKFVLLVFLLVTAVFSTQLVGYFDPIALFTRVTTLVFFPVLIFIIHAAFDIGFSLGVLEDQVYRLYNTAQESFLPLSQPAFYQVLLTLLLFSGILALGFFQKRFWCRNLCPLGALLGIFSKYRIVKRYVSSDCTSCSICQRECKMNAIEDDYSINNTVECIECDTCQHVCKPDAISYTFGLNPGKNEIDLSRRKFVLASVAGLGGIGVLSAMARDRNRAGNAIRPPGALKEDEFLDRCIRCQECVKICNSTGGCLQPALTQKGLESLWTPISIPRLGYCEYNCNLCGQVCPTGAIENLDIEEKKNVKMGTAYFDKSRCIPWYSHNDCLVCEEHCPVPDKAIKFDIQNVETFDGSVKEVKFPYVVEDTCIGCGICENKCPVVGKPGIFVTAATETAASESIY